MSFQKIKSNTKRLTARGRLEAKGVQMGIYFHDTYQKASIWIQIRPKFLNRSLLGDLLKVTYRYSDKRKAYYGQCIEIIKRTQKCIVARVVFEFEDHYYQIEGKTIPKRYYLIDQQDLSHLSIGQRVLIRFKQWDPNRSYPLAELIQTIKANEKSSYRNQINQIALHYGFQNSFPQKMLNDIQLLTTSITTEETKNRMDFRNELTFTIDQETAKDLDDAISFKKLPNSNYQIGIHIADVTHYLPKDSVLDREAYHRGTSVYFIDQVIPMLPEVLSNDLCSLNPSEDKLTFSVIFEMTSEGKVMHHQFAKTIINSNQRLSYQQVQSLFDENNHHPKNVHFKGFSDSQRHALLVLHDITKHLRFKRFKEGSLIIQSEEVKYEVDQDAHPINVTIRIQNQAQQLIEELMLLANRTVADFFSRYGAKIPTVYRVHDLPDVDGLEQISQRLKSIGITMNTSTDNVKEMLNASMLSLAKTPHAYWLSTLITKAMSKAQYRTKNIGHYGLGFDKYTHFTSPIRRYSDVLVHRILKSLLFHDKEGYTGFRKLEEYCDHINFQEINALKVEREVQKFMQCLYVLKLKQKGGTYKGYVSGLSRYGMFVELTETKCQGMVFFREVPDAKYSFVKNRWIIEKRKKRRKVVEIGDLLHVSIGKVSLERKLIDYHFIKWISP
ncbi:MAG: VacB/RNase II family 3'-5' exoribonuclease [Flavobacteriaceae bacterium]|nr:VacB/RNase II family 3'-5' exoribonuclease [Flavobacteriaceae bacterium]MCY4267605.1 VacB/RNase II family 3'-5' exoribonuclease [Flavobacteriaceae bacterium]